MSRGILPGSKIHLTVDRNLVVTRVRQGGREGEKREEEREEEMEKRGRKRGRREGGWK